jgi:hypothetical protein
MIDRPQLVKVFVDGVQLGRYPIVMSGGGPAFIKITDPIPVRADGSLPRVTFALDDTVELAFMHPPEEAP